LRRVAISLQRKLYAKMKCPNLVLVLNVFDPSVYLVASASRKGEVLVIEDNDVAPSMNIVKKLLCTN
jgi:hypothetical protein